MSTRLVPMTEEEADYIDAILSGRPWTRATWPTISAKFRWDAAPADPAEAARATLAAGVPVGVLTEEEDAWLAVAIMAALGLPREERTEGPNPLSPFGV